MRELVITKTDRSQRIEKEVAEKLKELQMLRRVQFMKKELVRCPKLQKEISPIYCMVCEYFRRRVKGKIYCSYP